MPSRMIRDGILSSRRVARLSFRDRWLYVGLLLRADDFGLFEADAAILRGAVYPRDLGTVSERDCERGLGNIQQAELVKFYTVNGTRYGALWNYGQRLKRKRMSHPPPPGEVVAWMSAPDQPAQENQNRTEPEPEEKLSRTEPKARLGISIAALAGYGLEHCRCKLDMGKALNAVGPEHDWALVQALEYLASRDERTRWQDVSNPLGLLISLAQQMRDGIGPHPEGPVVTVQQWQQQIQQRLKESAHA